MKLTKTFQGVLEFVSIMSIILIGITLDGEWTNGYVVFLLVNIALIIGCITLLYKYGRWE